MSYNDASILITVRSFVLKAVDVDLLVVFLQGRDVLSRLRETCFLHALTQVPVDTMRSRHISLLLRIGVGFQ